MFSLREASIIESEQHNYQLAPNNMCMRKSNTYERELLVIRETINCSIRLWKSIETGGREKKNQESERREGLNICK